VLRCRCLCAASPVRRHKALTSGVAQHAHVLSRAQPGNQNGLQRYPMLQLSTSSGSALEAAAFTLQQSAGCTLLRLCVQVQQPCDYGDLLLMEWGGSFKSKQGTKRTSMQPVCTRKAAFKTQLEAEQPQPNRSRRETPHSPSRRA
jgi:hypothetical protein